MKTEELLTVLKNAQPAPKPAPFIVLVMILPVLFTVMTHFFMGIRPEIFDLAPSISLFTKISIFFVGLLTAYPYLVSGSKPVSTEISKLRLLAFTGLLSFLIIFELYTYPLALIFQPFVEGYFINCVAYILLYGAMGSIAFVYLMRFYAPCHLKKTTYAISACACLCGAIGYGLHCPVDGPIFVTIAYGLPMIIICGINQFILPRFLRW